MSAATVDILSDPLTRKAVAQEHFDIICNAVGLVHYNTLRIGYHAHELERQVLFGILGFGTEEECREAAGVGRSTWYATKRLAGLFFGVDERLFCAMKFSNAEALGELPASLRLSEQWVRLASLDNIKDFRLKVDKELDGRATEKDGKETAVSLKISMPFSRKAVIEDHLSQIGEEMSITDPGRVLEFVLEERAQGINLIAAIQQALERIAELKRMEESNVSADEALRAIYSGLSGIVDILLGALESLQSETTA